MKPTPSVFRFLIVASVAFAIAGAVIDGTLNLVPETLRQAELEITPIGFTTSTFVASIGAGLAAAAAIAGIVGLLLFRPWGRRMSLVATAVLLVTYPFLGVVVASAPASTAYERSSMLWGAVLAMAYFSPLGARFDG